MRSSIRYAALPIAALVLLSGCSDDADDESSPTPAGTTSTAPTDTDTTESETSDAATTDDATDTETTDAEATESETTESGMTGSAAPGGDDPVRQEACLEAAELAMTFGDDPATLTDPDVVRGYAEDFGALAEGTEDEVIQPLLGQYQETLDEFATALEEQDFATIQAMGGDLIELASEFGEACGPMS